MRMPVMDGAKFLTAVRAVAPDVTRLLLTGETDIQSAIKAVNEGQIFRFLTKPCPPELLIRSLEGAVEQNRLVTSERELLGQTLRGSIQALCDVLSVANPIAFGRGTRVKRLATKIAQALGVKEAWAIEVAAMMSQIGYVVLPSATVERVLAGKPLSPGERQMVDKVPAIARQVVDNIPRLEAVREILDHSLKTFSGVGATPGDPMRGEKIPLGARILRLAFDYDQLEDSGGSRQDILKTLAARTGAYDPRILAALGGLLPGIDQEGRRALKLLEIRSGMVVVEDIKTSTGTLLMARGNEITESSLQRLFNFASSTGIREPIMVAGSALD
jgi:response regulator RpfG family c-di-GMP phosphodiesterase